MTRIEEERIDEMLAHYATPSKLTHAHFSREILVSILTELKELRAQGGVRNSDLAALIADEQYRHGETGVELEDERAQNAMFRKALEAVYADAVHIGSGQHAISDASRELVESALAFYPTCTAQPALETEAIEPVASEMDISDAVTAELLSEHSGCGHGIQIEQVTARLAPGDAVYVVRGKLGQTLLVPKSDRIVTLYAHPPHSSVPTVTGNMVERLLENAEVEWSYHEDDNRYPRDFWHIRIRCLDMSTEWTSYGEQEQRDLPDDIKAAAEKQQLGYLRAALTAALSPESKP